MFRKRQIVTTSAIITLILSNVSTVQATEQSPLELHNNQSQETKVIEESQEESQEEPQNGEHDLDTPQTDDLTIEEDGVGIEDHTEDEEETIQTFSLTAQVQPPSADELYNQVTNSNGVSQAWDLAETFQSAYPNDSRLNEVVNHAGRLNLNYGIRLHESGDYANASKYYKRLTSSPLINTSLKSEAKVYQRQADNHMKRVTGSAYYEKIINAKTVSQAWDLAKQYQKDFPAHSQLKAALNHAAELNLNYGIRLHDRGKYSDAIQYYNRVTTSQNIDNAMKDEAKTYYRQASKNMERKTGSDYYKQIIASGSVSGAWNLAEQFHIDFPNDPQLGEALSHAAKLNLNYGIRLHNSGDYTNALQYYHRVTSSPKINSTIKAEARAYQRQANNKMERTTGSDYYEQIVTSKTVSRAWSLAEQFQMDFPTHPQLGAALNHAAELNLNYGIKLHTQGDSGNAILYYNRVLDNAKINDNLQSYARTYHRQAQNKEKITTPADYYQKVKKSNSVTGAWNLVTKFSKDFPHDSLLIEALNYAAELNLNYGIRLHDRGEYSDAVQYYKRVITTTSINGAIKSEAEVYHRQASNNMERMTGSDYQDQILNSKTVSYAWNLAEQFKADFPNHSQLKAALNHAAELNLNYAMKLHRHKEFSNALQYYNRILNESQVNSNVRRLADLYSKQATNGVELTTDKDYYDRIHSAKSVTAAWNLVNQFERDFPNSKYLEDAAKHVAELNLNYGKKLHGRRDYSNALQYYNRALAASSITNSVKTEATIYHRQASNNMDMTTAEDYYQKILFSGSVSGAWNLAQQYETDYPGHSKLAAAVNHAAELNLNYGMKLHAQRDYKNAIGYYNRVLDNSYTSNSLKSLAKVYHRQASNNQRLTTGEDYYRDIKKSKSVTGVWNLATQFSKDFPQDPSLNKALNHAAEINLDYAIKLHKQGRFADAKIYYNRILTTDSINSNIFDQTKRFSNLAENNQKLLTVQGYYDAMKNSKRVSQSWSLAQEAMAVYPNNSKIIEGLNKVANQNILYARKLQHQGNATSARPYYVRIVNNEKIDKSIRHLAEVFLNQTYNNHRPLIYIDAGHGGTDPGATHYNVQEKYLNLRVSNYLKNELESRGYRVKMSRSSDIFIGLSNRPYEANDIDADIFISVHFNSMGGSGKARGIETFIHHTVSGGFGQETNRNKWLMDDPRISESVKLADSIHNNLIRQTGLYNRGVKGNNYNVLRNSYIPAVLLELGFMDNYNELSVITRDSYHRTSAAAIANGVDNYFKNIK